MDLNLILYCVIGGFVYADTTAVGQFGLSQPLFAAAIAGALLGNLGLGVIVGMLLQMPHLIEVPVGGTRVSVSSIGAYVASGLAVILTQRFGAHAHLGLTAALLVGIAAGWGAIYLQDLLRKWNLHLVRLADSAAESGDLKTIESLNYRAAVGAVLFGVAVSGIGFFLGLFILDQIIPQLPVVFEAKFQLVTPALLGAGLGSLVWLFVKNRGAALFSVVGAGVGGLIIFLTSAR